MARTAYGQYITQTGGLCQHLKRKKVKFFFEDVGKRLDKEQRIPDFSGFLVHKLVWVFDALEHFLEQDKVING